MLRKLKRGCARRTGAVTIPGAVALLMGVDTQAQAADNDLISLPEPSTIALMAAGAVGAIAYGANKRRKK